MMTDCAPDLRAENLSLRRERRRMQMALALERLAPAISRRPDDEWDAFQVVVSGLKEMIEEEIAREFPQGKVALRSVEATGRRIPGRSAIPEASK